jgi:hypothetical protein
MGRALLIAALTVLSVETLGGCVTARPVALLNGTHGDAIECSGAARAISDCMNKVAEVCGGPYNILDCDGSVIGAL